MNQRYYNSPKLGTEPFEIININIAYHLLSK